MTSRLRHEEHGFSLIELLVAMALGGIVLTALMTVFVNGLQATTRVTDRTEAAQRARLAVDRVVTLLNSQTCLYSSVDGSSSPPIVSGDAQQVTFLANTGTVSTDPSKYRLRYVASTKTLWEDRWAPTKDTKGNVGYATNPTASRVLGTNLVATLAGGTVFQYFQFKTDGTVDPDAPIALAAGSSLTTANMLQVVRVSVTMAAQPERTKTLDLRSATETGSATVGSADGADPSKGVNC
jgi:prepilin-type N-terminal cleavage/methylation domain-containing protein